MADQLQARAPTGETVYFLVRGADGTVWNGSALAAYSTGSYTSYDVAATEQGTASGWYTAAVPAGLPSGYYEYEAKVQAGGSPADLQKTMAEDSRRWAPIVKKSGFRAD